MKKSLNFIAPGKVAIVEEKIDDLKKGECMIQNRYSLISPGTELALFTGTHVGFKDPEISWAAYPLLPGYATTGTVIKCRETEDLCEGDMVMYYGPHSTHGTVNEKSDVWVKITEDMAESSLFARFAQISSTVPYLTNKKNGNALVFGAGMIGNFCAQLLQLQNNRKVIIADISANRLKLAKSCGIERTINSGMEDLSEAINSLLSGEGIDIAVEATGVPQLVSQSLLLINSLGSVYLLGSSRGNVEVNAYKHIHRKGASLIGAHESVVGLIENDSSSKPVRQKCSEMIDLLNEGKLITEGMITHRIQPEQAEEYYNKLITNSDDYLGVIINWSKK